MEPSVRTRPRRRPVLAAILVTALVAALALPIAVTAAPPPEVFCGVCGSDLEGATGAGTLDIRVDEVGDSRWVARVPVDEDAAERYRDDPAALEAAVNEAWDRYDVPRHDVRNQDVAVETADDGGPAVVVRFTVGNVARPAVGDAWLFEYVYAGGTQTRYDVEAERVTIHAPEGHVVTNTPSNAAVDGDAVTWTRDGGDPSRTTYITYGPEDAAVRNAFESRLTPAVAYGPLVIEHGVIAGLLPVASLGIGAAVVARLSRGRLGVESSIGRRLADVVAVVDRLAGQAGLAPVRAWCALAVGVAAGIGLLSWLAIGPATGILNGAYALAAGLFLPLGYGLERGSIPWRIAIAAVGTPLVGTVALGPYYGSWEWIVLLSLIFVPFVAVVVAVAYPLAVVGRRLARMDDRSRD